MRRRAGSPIVPVPTDLLAKLCFLIWRQRRIAETLDLLRMVAELFCQVASYYCTDLVSPMNQAGLGARSDCVPVCSIELL